MKKLNLLIAVFALLLSCTKPKVTLTYTEPPREYRGYIRRIAVLPFEGNKIDGRSLASEIEAELLSVRLKGKRYFKLITRSDIDKVLNELKFSSSGMTERPTELGRLLNAEGILTGYVDYSYVSSPYYERRYACLKTKGSGMIKECTKYRKYYVKCNVRNVKFLFIPKLIDVARGEIVYSKKIEKTAKAKHCEDYSNPMVSFGELLSQARKEAIRELVIDIAPHNMRVVVEFMDDDEGIGEKKEFEIALELAKEGRLEKSCSLFYQLRSRNYAVLYNLGICAELNGDLEKAESYYRKAMKLRKDERIEKALSRVLLRMYKERELQSLIK